MIPSYTLNDGHQLPALGFGTYPLRGPDGVDAIVSALRTGYRLIDSAMNYDNEGAVGEAVRRSGVPRDEIMIASKLPGRHHAYEAAISCVHESLYRMQVDHLDLYLIHWPNPSVDRYAEAWQALVDLQRAGLLRSIGVSNFLPEHLDQVIAQSGVTPAVNQVELHPYFPQVEQRQANADRGIRTESWSPLGRGREIFGDPVITGIAEAHGRTPAQIVLRWQVQLGTVPLPKAASAERQQENLAVFDFSLDDDQVAAITALGRPDGRLFGADPASHEEF
ncbi:MAG: aldo/keto reductase [Propionicimonas sp.]|uniref:aldo/keto reductase n=1 Tax=Propionicimonas sp. TaxID=1955623 RepID=UPI002B1F3B29|nr:aldo/keto reductase [Propionicimonas sp.]MEA4945569.1 aldo/keto reductase [Propionicimonas sp.]